MSIRVSTDKIGMEGVHGVRCKKMKAFINMVHCIKTKDAQVPIGFCVEQMPLLKGGQIVMKRHFMFHILFLFVKIISEYSQ